MTPSGKQIRAARALAGWERTDLAAKTGLSSVTIRYIENETNAAKKETVEKIVAAFSDIGIEFTENEGVRRRPEGIDVLNGPKGLEAFFDHVYEFLKTHGGLVCVSGVDEAQFEKHHGPDHAANHIGRMKQLVESRKDIQFKVLIKEGDMNFLASAYCHYRWLARENFVATPFYVFGDNLALISFQAKPTPKIMLIRSDVFAEAFRKQFYVSWKVAQKLSEEENGP